MTFLFSTIRFFMKNKFLHEPEVENFKNREYNLGKLPFQSKLVSKKIQQSEKCQILSLCEYLMTLL